MDLSHWQHEQVLRVTGVHEEVIPGVGNDGTFLAILLSGVVLHVRIQCNRTREVFNT